MKPTLIVLFALSVAVFADDTNRFQIITHINIDGSLGVMKLDRQTGKTWRYENRVGPEIIISEEGQALRERLGKIIIPRFDNVNNFNMTDIVQVLSSLIKANDPDGVGVNIIIIPGEKLPLPGGDYPGIDLTTGMPIGGGAPQIDPTTGKPLVDSNSTGKLRPNRQPGSVGGGRRNPVVDPTTGLPAGVGPGRAAWPGGGGLPGMGGVRLPGVGGGVPESIYELDPTTVKVKGINSALHNLSAFSLLHILQNSLDYPVQCIIDRHGIFLMPIGHPFIFLNGKPAETKNKSRWILVGESGG